MRWVSRRPSRRPRWRHGNGSPSDSSKNRPLPQTGQGSVTSASVRIAATAWRIVRRADGGAHLAARQANGQQFGYQAPALVLQDAAPSVTAGSAGGLAACEMRAWRVPPRWTKGSLAHVALGSTALVIAWLGPPRRLPATIPRQPVDKSLLWVHRLCGIILITENTRANSSVFFASPSRHALSALTVALCLIGCRCQT